MSPSRFLFLLCLLAAGWAPIAARAQEAPARRALEGVAESYRPLVVTSDSLLVFETRPVPGGRYDVREGVLRAAYRIDAPAAPGGTPEAAARAYLEAEAGAFGLRPGLDDLEVVAVTESPARTTHLLYRQLFSGLPVYGRYLRVNLDKSGRPSMVLSGYAPHLAAYPPIDPQPTLTDDDARAHAERLGAEHPWRTGPVELVVYPSKRPKLAWHVVAWSAAPSAEWSVLLDAHSGDILQILETSIDRGPHAAATAEPRPGTRPRAAGSAPAAVADGSGLVFDPDPLTTAGVPYGAPYEDADDFDVPELNAERREVVLREITLGSDGLYRLEGPLARITGLNLVGGSSSTPPAEPTPDGFRYHRSDDRFEAVMAYYHIDTSARYALSLDAGLALEAVTVNPHGLGSQDNSRFYPSQNAIAFGDGGIDDAEDADVIWHEFAHALLDASAPGLLSTTEGQALHEGWADYWAASYARHLSEEVEGIGPYNWRRIFDWDGNVTCWQGRTLDHPGRYPDDMAYPGTGCNALLPIYQHGLLWATTLMELYPLVGREVLDRLNLASHHYLATPVTFRDAAEALVQADLDLYDGAHASVLVGVLGDRGFLDRSAYGPNLTHTPLSAIEEVGGTREIVVEAVATTAPVDSVFVYYGMDGPPTQRLLLQPEGGDRYAGMLPLPETPGTVRYYVEALDESGQRSWLPQDAPGSTYQFDVGPDTEPPVLQHEAFLSVSKAGWPSALLVDARDNLGIDSVWVTYSILPPGSSAPVEGAFGLTSASGTLYQGTFPESVPVEVGTVVRYRVHARDAAAGGNETVLPTTGYFTTEIVGEGVLRAYSFEGPDLGFQATGSWARGAPAYGLQFAHSGSQAWATVPAGPYLAAAQRSTLELPPLNLEGISNAYLIFWHWHDFEHDGTAEPGRFNGGALLWDGGNVKVSADGGQTWTVAKPEGDYTGRLRADYGNPLGNEAGFGGYSYGWRREIVPLPAGTDVRIRFEVGTDNSNEDFSRYPAYDATPGVAKYAGWVIDDVTITTMRPQDAGAPEIRHLPAAVQHRPAGTPAPALLVRARDDAGVEAVLVDYTATTNDGVLSGTFRLPMSDTDPEVFAGVFPLEHTFEVGERITYRIRVRDVVGHVVSAPSAAGESFSVDYLLTEQRDALAEVRATGTWRAEGSIWSVRPDDEAVTRSSLVLAPVDLPANGAELRLTLEHRGVLGGERAGANVKISLDDGATWEVAEPLEGYSGVFPPASGHAMAGEPVLASDPSAWLPLTLDLAPYAGRQVRLRIDVGAAGPLDASDHWQVRSARYHFSTTGQQFDVPRELKLLANFPDPFSASTTLGYTLPEPVPVRLALYDLLGRRVALLVDGDQEAGTYTLSLEGAGLASGVYLLRLEAGRRQLTEKVVVSH